MNKKKKIFISIAALISTVIVIFGTVVVANYKNAPKKAENAVAIRLTKETAGYRNDRFLRFKKTYHTTKVKNGKYVIELSGSADIIYDYDVPFVAKVEVSPVSNNVKITKLTFNKNKIIK